MAKERRYLTAENGGMDLINIQAYGDALRSTWAKRNNPGLWSTILKSNSVLNFESLYTTTNTLHAMHWPLHHITNAFQNVCIQHGKQSGTRLVHTPIKYLQTCKIKQGRTKLETFAPTKLNLPALYVNKDVVNITLRSLSIESYIKNEGKCKIIFEHDLTAILDLDSVSNTKKKVLHK